MLNLDPSRYASDDMRHAIEIYDQHVKNKTTPTAEELEENSFLSAVHIIHLIDKNESSLKNRYDWMDLETQLRPLLTHALRHQEETRVLTSLLNLIKAWIHYKIHALHDEKSPYGERAESYFKVALKQEAKAEDPISGGLVHHFAALMDQNAQTLGLMQTAAEKGFDYAKFAFSTEIVQLTQDLMRKVKHPKNKVVQISLGDLSLQQLISTQCIYNRDDDRQGHMLKELLRSATLAHYYLAIRYLFSGKTELAIASFRQIATEGELKVLTHVKKDEAETSQAIKLFWKDLLIRDYSAFRNAIFNSLVQYNRLNKPGRFALRNEMLRIMITIDEQGSNVDDQEKIAQATKQLLPLIIRLAGTDLSSNQKLGMRSSSMPGLRVFALDESLSELSQELVRILVEIAGLPVESVAAISSESMLAFNLNANFDEKLARDSIARYIKNCHDQVSKRNKAFPLFVECKSEYDKLIGVGSKTPAHSLLFVANLESVLSKPNNVAAQLSVYLGQIYQQFCAMMNEDYDPLLILWNMAKQKEFKTLIQAAEIGEGNSLLNFQRSNRLKTVCQGSDREAVVSYVMALVLFSKKQYELGVQYLAKAYVLGAESAIFKEIDDGFAERFFSDRNWYSFYHLFITCMSTYANKQDNSNLKSLRRDYVNTIIRDINDIHNVPAVNDRAKIEKFKETILPMLIYLAGFNLGKTQRLALKREALKLSNLCKASKEGLNLTIQLLGLTAMELDFAVNRCLSKTSDNPVDTMLGIEVCRSYYQHMNALLQGLFSNNRKLEGECLPFVALAVGEFNWHPKQVSENAQKTFLQNKHIETLNAGAVALDDEDVEESTQPSEVFDSLPLNVETMGALSKRNVTFFQLPKLPPPPLPFKADSVNEAVASTTDYQF